MATSKSPHWRSKAAIDDPRNRRVVEEYDRRHSLSEVASIFGLSRERVSKIVERARLGHAPVRANPLNPDRELARARESMARLRRRRKHWKAQTDTLLTLLREFPSELTVVSLHELGRMLDDIESQNAGDQ
jgi:hypothetical protein